MLLALAALVAGCATSADGPRRPGPLPEAPALGAAVPAGSTEWSNASIAEVFTILTHDLETGGARPALVRLEPPVGIVMEGPGSTFHARFLADYLAFLRREAGIRIAEGDGASRLRIRVVEGDAFARILPGAACVFAPGEVSWSAFAARPFALGDTAMREARRLDASTIFLPADAPPHRVRACLLEEIPQALGLANDLSGLAWSIFNDDGAHLWPTRLDLLMLRVLYAGEIATGLDREATRASALTALDRLNPGGRHGQALPFTPDASLPGWHALLMELYAARPSEEKRRLARALLSLAESRAPESPQHCQARVLLARVERDLAGLGAARGLCERVHGPRDIRLAAIRLEEGRLLLDAGRPRAALGVTEGLDRDFADHRQGARLAGVYALRARAYRAAGRAEDAADADHLADAWLAHAFGTAAGPH